MDPVKLPPLRVKGPMPVWPLALAPVWGINETSPVGVPPPPVTLAVKLTGCPCTIDTSVKGELGLVSVSDVVVVVKLEVQLFTKLATLTVPNPVARS